MISTRPVATRATRATQRKEMKRVQMNTIMPTAIDKATKTKMMTMMVPLSVGTRSTDTEVMRRKMMKMTQMKATIMSPAVATKATKMRKRKMRLYPLNIGTHLLDTLTMVLEVRIKKRR